MLMCVRACVCVCARARVVRAGLYAVVVRHEQVEQVQLVVQHLRRRGEALP